VKIIDAEGSVVGRLASQTAKQILNGEKIVIVNAEKALMAGRKEHLFQKYKKLSDRSGRGNPRKGPHYPRTPDRLFKRIVRGMINYKSQRGKNALKNLQIYIGTPSEYEGKTKPHDIRKPSCDCVTLGEICFHLGWKGSE
jgi:large subunit ribosomal protein L13